MSVAWYPIYHIPMGRTIKDLSTCFLTYHTLSSSFQDMERPEENGGDKERMRKEGEDITLSPFGMATHKMQVNVWLSHDQDDQEKLVSLYSVADSWLKQLRVQHHDFNYFYTMSMTYHYRLQYIKHLPKFNIFVGLTHIF
ncbi:BnaC08g46230D [Brassica napus]|uniref:BnaC08g46230D protein n=1 Tax=Brassica napus TaxID=3708 RepID=A0A078IN28_BRANA|nr:BnaC08g46230D [Brassica napus]